MTEAAECRLDGDEDDEESVHSAISNASDFGDDEEVDYLALELVQHLPPDKVTRLCKNMQMKEKAVQDLLRRNRGLLESCNKLDEENQTLSERLKKLELERKQPAAAATSNVDTSVFAKMERGKEEKILLLQMENDRLKVHVRRLDEQGQQLDEALIQARKELKKLQQGRQPPAPQGKRDAAPAVDRQVLDEEERLFRELQSESATDLIVRKVQQQQEENREKVQAVLQALLAEDLRRIESWGSDVAAVMLAIEGLEGRLRRGPKDGEAAFGELRQVRSMGKALVDSLEAGRKGTSERMDQVMAALNGETAAPGDKDRKGQGAVASEAKRKKAKKKGKAEADQPSHKAEHEESAGKADAERPEGEEEQLRAELQEALSLGKAGTAGNDEVLTGPELMKELKSLRDDAEALEARMRMRSRGDSNQDEDALAETVAKPKVQRRKKMYA